MRVLIAEDDAASRTLLAALLHSSGHVVEPAVDGAEAWAALQRPDAPRLAVLDWEMPGMDGVEVCRRVRALGAEEPPYLILLTARDRTEDVVQGLNAGANDYLVKPFEQAELRARIDVGCRVVELQGQLAGMVRELREALSQVRTLRGIVPICAACKKIRDDKGYWEQVEVYVRDHSEAEFSHSMCPDCMKKWYPGFVDKEG